MGLVVGTTTKPLDEKPKIIKRCTLCDNRHPDLTDNNGNYRDPYFKTMLLDQEDPAHEGPGGTLNVVCYPCFLSDNGANLATNDRMNTLLRELGKGNGQKKWSDIHFTKYAKLCNMLWERRTIYKNASGATD